MAETHVDERPAPDEPVAPAHVGRHPGPKEYIRIAIILGVITALEVAVYYLEGAQDYLIPLLFFFSFVKFTLVVMWFMHLKFDSRTYARFFVMGLAGALTLFLIVLLIFQVFSS
jgi:cytochrome c oxidase subunit IV